MAVPEPDEVLLQRWRADDATAGQELFERYFDPLLRFFSNKVAEPDDLVQKTFLSLVKARDQFAGRASFRTYLFAIARNALHSHLRTVIKERDFDPAVSSIANIETSIRGRLVRDQQHRKLCEALRALPEAQQTLLELHYWEGLDAPALAEVFEEQPQTIRARLSRARTALRELLGAADDSAIETFRP